MKTYNKYKSSNITWMGSIPEHWILTKTKFFSSFRMGQTILKEELIEDGEYPVYSATEGDHYFGRTNNPSFVLEVGDIVIPARGNSIGHIALVHEAAVCTQTTIANFVNQEKINSHFLYYFYKGFRKTLFQYDNTAIPQITVDQVKQNPILLPTLVEQVKIARFLDHQTGVIDDLIKQKEKLIELLKEKRQAIINEAVTKGLDPKPKMKDSGIEWLGEVNVDWTIKKIKHTTFVKGRIGWQNLRAEDFLEEGPHLVTGTDFLLGKINWDGCHRVDEERFEVDQNIILRENDVLITKDGTIGKIAIVKNKPEKATLNSGVFVTRPLKDEYLQDYMYWLLNSDIFTHFIDFNKSGATILHLYQNVFEEFSYSLPDKTTQKKIVDFLEATTLKFDDLISKLNNSVNKVKEYRQSLISEAVTGKIDVRDWQPIKKAVA